MENNFDIVVIGGGPAGITLAKRLGNKKSMAVIRPEDASMIYCAMPYVIEDLIDKQKCLKKDALITDSGASLIRGKVVNIDFDNKTVLLENDDHIKYHKLVIASGANPFIPPIKGDSLDGVMGFKSQKDLETILGLTNNGLEKAVVVGAGAIGIELAQALKNKGLDVSLVDMAPQVLPNLVGTEFSQKAAEELIKNDIHLILNAQIESLEGKQYVNEVHLNTGETIYFGDFEPCTGNDNKTIKGLVIFATGVKPELSFIPPDTIKTGKNGIIVNEHMETNIQDVYAVGDCTEYKHFITGKFCPGKLATNAVPMARVLANNLNGRSSKYPGFINGAATKIYNYYVGGTGLTSTTATQEGYDIIKGNSQLTTQFPIMPGKKELRLQLLADKKTQQIIGGQVLSGEPVTNILDLISFAIQQKATILDITKLSYSAQPYQSFFPANNPMVMAAEELLNKLNEKSK